MAKASKKTTKTTTKKEKKPKMKNNFFWGFNIKLTSTRRSGEDAYFDMIHQLFMKDIRKPIGNGKMATLSSQKKKEYAFNGTPYKVLYGRLTRYSLLEGSQWYNEATKQYEQPVLPKGIYPDAFDTDYIFFPEIHKFYIVNNTKVSSTIALAFLQEGLREVIEQNESYTVSILQSQDTINAIINAPSLKDLYVNLSVTNDDAGDKAQEAVDKLLKTNNIGRIEAKFKPDATGNLNTKQELIRGLIELAKDNGEAVANVVNENGKKTKVVTSKFPEKINIPTAENEDLITKLFGTIMPRYRHEPNANK
jgi:hypothetical protein